MRLKKLSGKKGTGPSFQKIQQAYGLKTPDQIKLKIIWHHLQALVRGQYPGTETDNLLRKYDNHWRQCEREEGR
jgi:hypothetical protein